MRLHFGYLPRPKDEEVSCVFEGPTRLEEDLLVDTPCATIGIMHVPAKTCVCSCLVCLGACLHLAQASCTFLHGMRCYKNCFNPASPVLLSPRTRTTDTPTTWLARRLDRSVRRRKPASLRWSSLTSTPRTDGTRADFKPGKTSAAMWVLILVALLANASG